MSKYALILLTFSLLILSLNHASYAQEEESDDSITKEVQIIIGIDHIERFNFAPSPKVQVGNEGILTYDIIPQKREITLKGTKPGETSVTIRNPQGDIRARFLVRITANSQSRIVQELRELLGDIEGLEIGIKGNSVYLGGRIVVPGDIGKIVVVLQKYPDVMNLVELSPLTQRVIARKMQDEIQANGMKDVTVKVINGLFWLEGMVSNKDERIKAETIAAALLPDQIETLARRLDAVKSATNRPIIQNFIGITPAQKQKNKKPPPKMLKITTQFVELSKDYTKVFGFKWSPVLGGDGGSIAFGRSTEGGVTTEANGTLAGTISNLFPKLASAKSAGYARVVQSGILVVKDKVEGTINKNTTTPYQLGTNEFTKSDKATAGFDLKVKPTILPQEQVDLDVGISVSANVGNPPSTLSNKISTNIVVKTKESAVLGGIVVSKTATDFDKNPPGGIDEVEGGSTLFNFLRSKSYANDRSQFVVFITPEIIENASLGTESIKKKFRRRRR